MSAALRRSTPCAIRAAARVVVRSRRGLEVGEVLAEPDGRRPLSARIVGQILRRMSVQDDLLEARLERRRHEAFDGVPSSCWRTRASTAALVDVEHLFDGEGLFFYFLGDPPQAGGRRSPAGWPRPTRRPSSSASSPTRSSEGCGPGCGTEEAKGQGGCASCTSCAVASACGTKKAP